jgi:hypothetical protein
MHINSLSLKEEKEFQDDYGKLTDFMNSNKLIIQTKDKTIKCNWNQTWIMNASQTHIDFTIT